MSKSKRDIAILVIIGLIFYSVIYYKFVLVDAIAKVEDINSKIELAEKKKQKLENDLKNIEQLKRSVEMKKVQDDRLDNYLLDEANLSDNIDYVDKLIKLFDNRITEANISEPKENVSNELKSKYYEFSIQMKAALSYDQTMNLVNYLEGGSQKVKITKFDMKPDNTINNTNGANTPNVPNEVAVNNDNYAIDMTINLYSISLNSLDKVYEYSRKNFLRHSPRNEDGVFFAPASITSSIDSNNSKSSVPSSSGSSTASVEVQKDLQIMIDSFLAAGSNFSVYAKGESPFGIKTTERVNVTINFRKEDYDVNVTNSLGKSYKVSGKTKNEVIGFFVTTYFTYNVKENKNLGADIQIINDSGKNIKLSLNDKNNCVVFKDRSGNLITGSSNSEKIYIL